MSEWTQTVERHQSLLRKRGHALSWEHQKPTGQAAEWYWDCINYVIAPSARHTAQQIARLCGDDSQVIVPWRSLADAVGITDKAGRGRAYVERGVEMLTDAGWLEVETVGRGRGAKTIFRLLPGERIGPLDRWIAELETEFDNCRI